jgi:predicted ester cyclase
MTTVISANERLYGRFADAFNRREYDRLDAVMAPDFRDHHPGLVDVTSLDVYKQNLAGVIDALQMRADPEVVTGVDDLVFTRIRLSGRHVGTFFGVPATDNLVEWYTHELWRAADGRFVERWAVDDLAALLSQIGVTMPSWGG